jgi:hypothetical protein
MFLGFTVLVLNGCGGEGDVVIVEYNDYYIERVDGSGVADIVWSCDSGTSGVTNAYGHFYTDSSFDTCDLDLHENLIINNIYLADNIGSINGVSYTCEKPWGNILIDATTGPNGYIDDATDYYRCTLYNLP